jgi:hypothetical protein
MKPAEILLASAVIALVAGAGAALATRALSAASPRAESPPRPLEVARGTPDAAAGGTERSLDDLRLANASLRQRVEALEVRLAEVQSARTAVAVDSPIEVLASDELAAERHALDGEASELTPAFVDSVGQALEKIKQREDAEREKKRKELQAQRVEERVARLQQELGLNNRQTSDLRTALITQDDKRDALFANMRDGVGDPRDMRDSFRVIRDETYTTLQGILTAEQLEGFKKSEEMEFGRRGPGDFGPGGRPPEGGFERRGR